MLTSPRSKAYPRSCLSTNRASRFTVLLVTQRGGLGSWHRHHQSRQEYHAPCHLRREEPAPPPPADARQHARRQGAVLAINAVPPWEYLVADKGYESNALPSWLIERGTTPAIPLKSNRKVQIDHNRQINRQRNVLKRMFCRFKDWCQVATGFDRNIKTFMATVDVAACVTWWL